MSLYNFEAPVGGWDALHAYDNMPANRAIKLINWVPDAGYCRFRGGSREHASGLGAPVKTLAGYAGPTADALIAGADGKLWNASVTGALGASDHLGTGFSSDEWQHTQHSAKMILVNGVDTPQVFDGTALTDGVFSAWADPEPVTFEAAGNDVRKEAHGFSAGQELRFSSITTTEGLDLDTSYYVLSPTTDTFQVSDTPGGNAVALTNDGSGELYIPDTSLDPSKFIQCNTFKSRVFYIPEDDSGFWYAQAGSYQGELNYFDLAPFTPRGGKLMFMITWTLDGGQGVDDLAVFVMSTGTVLVYAGDDPQDINAWSSQGRFQIGEPLSRRSFTQVGGDNILLTKDGYLNLSAALKEGRYSEGSLYSLNIVRAAKQAANAYDTFFGWECILYPRGNLFLVNVPVNETTSEQHVRNTNTGAWTKFEGWNAKTFALYGDSLFFGTDDGRIMQGDVGTSDDGEFILYTAVPAYQHPTANGKRVQVTACEMVSTYVWPSHVSIEGMADYESVDLPIVDAPPEGVPTNWDIAPWDTVYWGIDDTKVVRGWQSIMANGYAVTATIRMKSRAQLTYWYSTNFLVTPAGDI